MESVGWMEGVRALYRRGDLSGRVLETNDHARSVRSDIGDSSGASGHRVVGAGLRNTALH